MGRCRRLQRYPVAGDLPLPGIPEKSCGPPTRRWLAPSSLQLPGLLCPPPPLPPPCPSGARDVSHFHKRSPWTWILRTGRRADAGRGSHARPPQGAPRELACSASSMCCCTATALPRRPKDLRFGSRPPRGTGVARCMTRGKNGAAGLWDAGRCPMAARPLARGQLPAPRGTYYGVYLQEMLSTYKRCSVPLRTRARDNRAHTEGNNKPPFCYRSAAAAAAAPASLPRGLPVSEASRQ